MYKSMQLARAIIDLGPIQQCSYIHAPQDQLRPGLAHFPREILIRLRRGRIIRCIIRVISEDINKGFILPYLWQSARMLLSQQV